MNTLMQKPKMSVDIMTVLSGILVLFLGWTTWNSIQAIRLGEQTSAIIQWQETTSKNLVDYQDSSDKKIEQLNDKITTTQIDSAVTKELVKIMSDKQNINTAVVEARVIRENRDNKASSTLSVK